MLHLLSLRSSLTYSGGWYSVLANALPVASLLAPALQFLKFVTMCNVIDEHLTMPKVEELFLTTVRSSSRGAKKFSRKIQFDDFVSAVAEMADIKFPYGGISGGGTAIDNMLTDYVWPMSARQKIKEALGSRRSSQFEMNWFKPDVMAFFNSQNEPLTKIFKRYSSISASSDSVMTISDRKDTHKQNMMLTQFCQVRRREEGGEVGRSDGRILLQNNN